MKFKCNENIQMESFSSKTAVGNVFVAVAVARTTASKLIKMNVFQFSIFFFFFNTIMMFDFTAPKPDFANTEKKTHPSRPEDRGSTIHLDLLIVVFLTFLAVSTCCCVNRTQDKTLK